ncbi:N-acetylglucosamine kinase [Streptomyces racemochromogenes]|uniref:N-acetylglucosamine kinase n=1 Tax=Streptomyces racemochromogenes TaxID=67353 RepID=UPI0035E5BFBC
MTRTARPELVLGIDAGGSGLRVAVAAADGGPPLATASAGAGNARSVPERLLEQRLAHAIGEVLADGRAARVRCVVAGFAGAGAPGGAGARGNTGAAGDAGAGAGGGTGARDAAGAAGTAGVAGHAGTPGPGAGAGAADGAGGGTDAPGSGAGGGGWGAARRALGAALTRYGVRAASVHVLADSEVAFAAAPGTPPDGLVLVAGTGAAAVRIRGHRLAAAADGCGWLTGDDGSGFWIAREGLRRALRGLDGRGPATALLPRLAAAFGAGPAPADPYALRYVLIDGARAASEPARLARLCPVVFDAAADGDPVAEGILDEAAGLLAESAAALRPRRGEPLVTVGGLIGPAGPLLPRLTTRLSAWDLTPCPVADGLPGAIALARAGAKPAADRGA